MAGVVRKNFPDSEFLKAPDETFSKHNRVSCRMVRGGFDLAYASIRGRAHVKSGAFREDDVAVSFFMDDKAVAMVVSDGAGSAALSRRGSRIVAAVGVSKLVDLGMRLCEQGFESAPSEAAYEGFRQVVSDIRQHITDETDIIQQFEKNTFKEKEMYATFLAALVLPCGDGHVLFTYSVGDGAIGLGAAGKDSGIKCIPDHGQSAGQTLFIQSNGADDAKARLRFCRLPDRYALLLMTDGVSDAIGMRWSQNLPGSQGRSRQSLGWRERRPLRKEGRCRAGWILMRSRITMTEQSQSS
jgi:hypothetical protein